MAKKLKAAEILAAILKATGEKAQGKKEQGKKEKREDFLKRLAEGINDLKQEKYDKLPSEIQEWYEEVVEAAEKEADEIPDFDPEAEEAEEKEEKEESKKKKLVFGKKKKGKKEEEEEEEEPKKKKGKGEKEPGKSKVKDKLGYRSMAEAVRHIFFTSKGKISFEDLKEKVEERGFTGLNELGMYDNYNHSKGAYRVLEEMGKL